MKTIKFIMPVIIILIILLTIYLVVMNNIIPKNIGVEDGVLSKMPNSPNAVSSQTFDTSKFVEPFKYLNDFENSRDCVIRMIKEFNGTKIITDENNYIHVVFSTPFMRFKDDVEFYFDDINKVIHFRSASRIGYSDNGLNRNRYNELSKIYYSK
jgi:uncharacterized protein (DUF1499 family)